MRELHVVAVSPDGRHVVLAPTKNAKATHRVRLDARLVAAVRGELPGFEPSVDLSPKDIQARLRAGESAEQIARSAGVAITRVERFAGPVAGEMARMIAAARDAFVIRGRRGPSTVALGTAVDAALGQETTWTTHRDEDGRWRVAVSWHARGRDRTAAWHYEPATKAVTAADPASAALGHVDSSARTPVSRPAPAPKPKVTPARKPVAKAAPKPTVSAKNSAANKTAAKKPAAKAPAKPTPQPASLRPAKPVKKAPTKRAPKTTAPAARPRLQVVPPPAPSRTSKSTPRPSGDGVRTRASVPGWADVLLGTTPGVDR